MFAITDHARELITSVRARVISDAVALTAALSPEHASVIAHANHVTLRKLEVVDEEQGKVCVVIQSGHESSRACAELTTSTLDD
jgi:nitrate reductase NapAB chaperone NapD